MLVWWDGTFPVEVDLVSSPPAVHGPLVGGLRDQPSQGDEIFSGLLDTSDIDAEDTGDPGGLDLALGAEPPPAPSEASQEDGEDGGDECGSGAADQESEDATGDSQRTVTSTDGVMEAWFVEILWFGKGDGGLGPGEESGGNEAIDGGSGPFLGDAGESSEFGESVVGVPADVEESASSGDFVASEPGAKVGDAEWSASACVPCVEDERW